MIILIVAGVARTILGIISQMLIAAKFGASAPVDAYLIGITIPNLFGDFLIGAVILYAFIPVFIEYKTTQGEEEAWKIAGTFVMIAITALLLLTIIYCLAAPFLISLLAPGFSEGTGRLAVILARVMSPTLVFFGLAIVFTSVLHSYQHFTTPAFSHLAFVLAIIVSILLLWRRLGIYSLALGALVGAFLQSLCQLLALARIKVKHSFGLFLRHPGVIKVGKLIVPVLATAFVYQVSSIVIRLLASTLAEGSIAALNFANQIIRFPQTIVGASIGIAIFPTLSQQAAKGDFAHLRETFSRGMRMIFFIIIPMAVGLVVLRTPIVQLLFERGLFGKEATQLTAGALFYFSLGLFALSANLVVTRTFYSLQDMITPLKVGTIGVAINILLSLVLIRYLALSGLALAFSIYTIVVFIFLLFGLQQKLKGIDGAHILGTFLKAAIASVAMGFVIWPIHQAVGIWGAIFIGAAVFFLVATILKMGELEELMRGIKGFLLPSSEE